MNSQTRQHPPPKTARGTSAQRDIRRNAGHGTRDGERGAGHVGLDLAQHKTRYKIRDKIKVKKPRMFKVVLLNDDYTPMEFVVRVLQRFFRFNDGRANRLMLEIHRRGRGVCGVFSREIAETKAVGVNRHSRSCKHPLLCVIEPDSDAE